MSGQIIGQVVGTVIGFTLGGPIGGAIGGGLGGALGSTFDTLPTQYGPRLEDLRPQTSEYGKPIPLVYGTVGMGGNVIWASDYIEVENKTEQGGKGGPSQSTVTYSYLANFAILLAEGPCSVGRMWAGPSKRLIYDGALLEGGGTVRIYEGTEDQLPDPLIESYEGVGNVPAHRGVCYVVFENFPLENDGNAIPFITAEVGAKAGLHGQEPVLVYDDVVPTFDNYSPHIATVDPLTGWIWVVKETFLDSYVQVQVINDATKELIREWTIISPFGPVNIKGVSASAGLVWVFAQPWALFMRRAGIANFTSGQANADGTVKVMPEFVTWMKMGKDGVAVGEYEYMEKPIDAHSLLATDTDVWFSYAMTAASNLELAYFPIGAMSFDSSGVPVDQNHYGTFVFQQRIGIPYHMAGDKSIIGVAGYGGAENFVVIDATNGQLLHSKQWLVGAIAGKAFDYDPKRKQFISWNGGFPGSITVLNAITGEIQTQPLAHAPGDTSPQPSPNPNGITYSARTDKYLVSASSVGSTEFGSTIFVVDPDTLQTQFAATFEAGAEIITPLLDPLTVKGAPYVLAFDKTTLKRLYIGGMAAAAPANLGEIVADLSLRAGLTPNQVDVVALTDMVDGYAIARQTTVRAAIDALRPAYYFDAVESGGKVKYVKRGGAAVAVIDDDDLDAHQADGQPGDPLLTTRQMEVELPKTVNVNYLLAATDYEKATQIYKRQVGSSEEETTLDLPLVLSDTKAQEIAQVNAHLPWVQRLRYGPFNLPRKYSALEPTDIITVRGYEMMLEKVTASPGGVLTCEAVATDSSHYTPHVVVTETVPTEKAVYTPGETVLELM